MLYSTHYKERLKIFEAIIIVKKQPALNIFHRKNWYSKMYMKYLIH